MPPRPNDAVAAAAAVRYVASDPSRGGAGGVGATEHHKRIAQGGDAHAYQAGQPAGCLQRMHIRLASLPAVCSACIHAWLPARARLHTGASGLTRQPQHCTPMSIHHVRFLRHARAYC
eukprot:352375-Chlamydomonas_euryale.AAC.4